MGIGTLYFNDKQVRFAATNMDKSGTFPQRKGRYSNLKQWCKAIPSTAKHHEEDKCQDQNNSLKSGAAKHRMGRKQHSGCQNNNTNKLNVCVCCV